MWKLAVAQGMMSPLGLGCRILLQQVRTDSTMQNMQLPFHKLLLHLNHCEAPQGPTCCILRGWNNSSPLTVCLASPPASCWKSCVKNISSNNLLAGWRPRAHVGSERGLLSASICRAAAAPLRLPSRASSETDVAISARGFFRSRAHKWRQTWGRWSDHN